MWLEEPDCSLLRVFALGGKGLQSGREDASLNGVGRQSETVTPITLYIGIGWQAEGGKMLRTATERGCLPRPF